MVTLNTCYTLQFYTGLQADTKPLGVPNGSMFLEMDTGKLFRFDAENQTWIDQANPTPSGGNDMFIITITQDGDDYSADKTYDEIVAAYEDGSVPVAVFVTSGGATTLFYLSAIVESEMGDGAVFQSMPNISGSGVSSQGFYIADTNAVTFMEMAYPGE